MLRINFKVFSLQMIFVAGMQETVCKKGETKPGIVRSESQCRGICTRGTCKCRA